MLTLTSNLLLPCMRAFAQRGPCLKRVVLQVMQQSSGRHVCLFQLGDNALEELSSTLHTLGHQRDMDMLELGHGWQWLPS
jgi:hypothetical protein